MNAKEQRAALRAALRAARKVSIIPVLERRAAERKRLELETMSDPTMKEREERETSSMLLGTAIGLVPSVVITGLEARRIGAGWFFMFLAAAVWCWIKSGRSGIFK